MRILSLHCIAFGCFTNLKLDLADPGRTFHVIYGPNEAGKSTVLRALTGLLYGIPARTTDAFLHDMKDLRIAAELEHSDGRRFTFIRRKGNRDTLLDVEGKPILEKKIEEFLGGVGEDLFHNLFRLDHPSLVRGGEDLLAGKGDVAQSLFEAGTGITGLRQVLTTLDTEADSLFTQRSKAALVNHYIAEYETHHKRVRELSVPAREWAEKRIALEDDEKKLTNLKARLSAQIARKERLNRLNLAIPHVSRRSEILKELSALGPVKELSESASRDREAAQQRERDARRRKTGAENKLKTLHADLDKLQTPQEFLDYAERIAGVYERLASYRNAVRDLPKVRAEQQESERQAIEILRGISPGLPLAEAETLRLTVAQRTRIRGLVSEQHKLQERLRTTRKRAQSTEDAWQGGQRALREMPQVKDAGELERIVTRVFRQGDLEAAVTHETGELTVARAQVDADVSRLPLWTGTLDQLETLKIPTLERMESFENELEELNNQQRFVGTRSEENRQQAEAVGKEIQTLQIGWAIPTKDDLQKARDRRDHGWRLVRRAWIEGKSDADEEKEFDGDRPLDQGYEKAVLSADEVADRLWREADRTAKLAGLQSEKDSCEAISANLETEQSKITATLEDWQRRWNETWRDSGIAPGLPKEMRAWLGRHQDALTQICNVRVRQQSIRQKQESITGYKEQLDRALQELGEPGVDASQTLAAALERCKSIVDTVNNSRKERTDFEKDVQRLAKEHSKAATELLEAERESAAWQDSWQKALLPLNLSDEISAEEASAIVEKLEELFNRIASGAEKGGRISEMTGHIAQFETDVSALVVDLDPKLSDLQPEPALIRLQALLTSAQKEASTRKGLTDQVKGETKIIGECDREITGAQSELADLMAKAGCEDLTALELAENQSNRIRVLKGELKSMNQTISGFSAGKGLDSLVDECEEIESDTLSFEIAELEKEITSLGDERSALDRKIGGDRTALEAIDGSDQAAAAEEEAQSALASVRDHAERYLQVKVAAEVLRRHIERYREQNQDPILRRASEVFRQLTLGSFQSLKTGFDEKDRPVLLGVRPSMREVEVAGMSDGTRDQLFLALRLASLELQLASAESLPFVADDVLINFDDGRAEATIVELANLSSKTQVLFFTHHARLSDLARKAVPEHIFELHDLTMA